MLLLANAEQHQSDHMKYSKDKILKLAEEFDGLMEKKEIDKLVSYFSNDCTIYFFDRELKGKQEAKKWLLWLYSLIDKISFKAITIKCNNNIFFEEFILYLTIKGGKKITSKQSEILVFDDKYKIKELKLYMNKMDFIQAFL